MDSHLKRSVILQHYQNPLNKGLIDDDKYIKINMNNQSCIDEIDLMVKIEDEVIKDIKFDGEACAICTSSTSIMIETLTGQSLKQAQMIYDNFVNMINEQDYDDKVLGQAVVYEDIAKQPNRKKCALLPWWGIKRAIDQVEEQ